MTRIRSPAAPGATFVFRRPAELILKGAWHRALGPDIGDVVKLVAKHAERGRIRLLRSKKVDAAFWK
jgi:hypothetical protein